MVDVLEKRMCSIRALSAHKSCVLELFVNSSIAKQRKGRIARTGSTEMGQKQHLVEPSAKTRHALSQRRASIDVEVETDEITLLPNRLVFCMLDIEPAVVAWTFSGAP